MDIQVNFLDGRHYGDKETNNNIINSTHMVQLQR